MVLVNMPHEHERQSNGSTEQSRVNYIDQNLQACRILSWLQHETSFRVCVIGFSIFISPFRVCPQIFKRKSFEASAFRRHRREPEGQRPLCLSLCQMPVRGDWWNKMLASCIQVASCIKAQSTQGYSKDGRLNMHFPKHCKKLTFSGKVYLLQTTESLQDLSSCS